MTELVKEKIQVGQINVERRAQFTNRSGAALDCSSATTKTYRYTLPSGTSVDQSAGWVTDGSDGWHSYTITLASEFSEMGNYEEQFYNNVYGWSPVHKFFVGENLDAP